MTQTVTALYDTYDSAISAVNALEVSGVPHSDISIVSNNVDNRYHKDRLTSATEDAGKGAGIGAAVGGVGGLLTGLGLLAIPGVGPVVAAGWLVATAAGAATGAVVGGAAGGLIGSLTGAGVAERDAHFYAEGVRRGGTLVTARVDDARASAAQEILQRYKSVDPAVRGAAYREGGWTSFDETAPAYTADQVAAERASAARWRWSLPRLAPTWRSIGSTTRLPAQCRDRAHAAELVGSDVRWRLIPVGDDRLLGARTDGHRVRRHRLSRVPCRPVVSDRRLPRRIPGHG